MFRKILIANRGEVALRIIRACRELGVATVAVHSEADRDSLPVMLADEAICIGPGPARDSYLNASRLLAAGEVTHCEALHPGYGFLSESSAFAEATEAWHLKFIGPGWEAMRLLGDKIAARDLARRAGVPVAPGSDGEVRDAREAAKICAGLGYPVMIKAAAGGGGKGMRAVRGEKDLETGFRLCQAEAGASFGDPRVYLEKLIANPRHVEIQVLADEHGNVIHLGERDCSAQRRHQKFLEESPSPAVSAALRMQLGDWSVALARTAGYVNAGTVEFLLDEQDDACFIEMNCRLQVEHPITEMVSGVDVVREQIRIAAGEKLDCGLRLTAYGLRLQGHALECRICAEDPEADFEPNAGRITELHLPAGPGIRVDSHLTSGCSIPPFYDSLLAKIIAWGPTRPKAIARMEGALAETVISGIPNTLTFLRKFLENEAFLQGKLVIGRRAEVS
jgi:acetyl-CoA carboxylase biotin carboxylase subunit